MRVSHSPAMSDLTHRTSVSEDWSSDGIVLFTLRAVYETHPWTEPVLTDSWGLTLVRRGAYRRRANGIEHVVDVNAGFFRRPGEESAIANFATETEELTVLDVDPVALDLLPPLSAASGPLAVTPSVALAHRLLVQSVRNQADDLAVQSAVAELLQTSLAEHDPDAHVYTRRSTETARHRLVSDVLELLHTSDEQLSLLEVARSVGSSPFHLCRVFREVTGVTISQYRTRLRVHAVLDGLSEGVEDLSSLAVSTGFADHSHMTRTVVNHFGRAPSALRRLLSDRATA